MGASQSIPSTLSRQKVFELTRDTRGMMDVLLDYMLKEITVRDFLALSNPAECKKYVIFLANNLYKHFYELQITPAKDKKGLIAFRPVKDLTTPTQEDENEKQTLCLTLAYFYTRIFQIYGALALTVLDDAKVMMESGVFPLYNEQTQRGLLPPGYRPYVSSGGGSPPAASLGNFNFLRSFLYDEKDPQKGFLSSYSGEGDSRGIIYFYPKIDERDELGRPVATTIISETKLQKGIFFIGYTGGKMYAQLEGYAKVEGIGGDTKFSFGKFKYYKKDSSTPESIELPSDILTQKSIVVERDRPGGARAYIYTIKGSDKNIADFFNDVLSKVVVFLKQNSGDTTTTTTTSGIIISETGTAEELRLAKIVQNLTRTKPLGHCLARAMQLLQTIPLKGEDAVSYICKAKFLEQTTTSSTGTKTYVSRSGIPEPGSSLDTSPGMAALSQLFYDTIIWGSPKVTIGTKPGPDGRPSTLQQYVDFMRQMGNLFGDREVMKNPDEATIKRGLSAIRDRRDSEICKGLPERITVPANKVASVSNVVNNLYQIQVKHAAECAKIIKLLFDIQRDKSSGRYRISLSENIIKKGFPEIERVNYEARRLLVNYYSNCEATYLQGVKIIYDSSPQVAELRAKTSPKPPVSSKPPAAPGST